MKMDAVDFQDLTTFFFKVTQSFLNLWFMLTSESRVEIFICNDPVEWKLPEAGEVLCFGQWCISQVQRALSTDNRYTDIC